MLSTKLCSINLKLHIVLVGFNVVHFLSVVLVKHPQFQFCSNTVLERKMLRGEVRSKHFSLEKTEIFSLPSIFYQTCLSHTILSFSASCPEGIPTAAHTRDQWYPFQLWRYLGLKLLTHLCLDSTFFANTISIWEAQHGTFKKY